MTKTKNADDLLEEALQEMGAAEQKVNAVKSGPFKEEKPKSKKQVVEEDEVVPTEPFIKSGEDPYAYLKDLEGVLPESELKIVKALRAFCLNSGLYYTYSPDTPQARWYATHQAFSFLLHLNQHSVEIQEVWQKEVSTGRYGKSVDVYCTGVLVDNSGDIPRQTCKATMVASMDEDWLKGKQLSAAYGLVQTRVMERLARSKFGYQLTLARLCQTGAEELDVVDKWYQTKDKEI